MEPRLQSELLVTALRRRAESLGGFAAVLARGDSTAGAILVILAEKGRKARILERSLGMDGRYLWYSRKSLPFMKRSAKVKTYT